MSREEIERIALNVMAGHGCHTVILYGSWARGQATPESDVDLVGICESGPGLRDARIVEGIYIDAFIYPEAALKSPDAALLRILGGVVLRERDGFGSRLLFQLQELHDRGPTPLSEDEFRARVLWSSKMLERLRGQRGVDSEYRRMQLLLAALEDYFVLRNAWYRGPKEALAWLVQHDPATYQCFERATQPGGSEGPLAELVRNIYEPDKTDAV